MICHVFITFSAVRVYDLSYIHFAVLSVRFEVSDSLLLAPGGADKRGPKAPFPLVENAGIQPAIRKRVPAGAPAVAGYY